MKPRPLTLPATLLLSLGLATAAHAQSKPDAAYLPVLDNSGQVEGMLMLEPTGQASGNARWRLGGQDNLNAAFGLDPGDSLGLVCNGSAANIGSLISRCNVASLDGDHDGSRGNGLHGGWSVGNNRGTLPSWLTPRSDAPIEQNNLAVFGEKNIGREGFVRIGGAVAHAQLIPVADLPPAFSDHWSSKSLSVGGGYGNVSANIIGRVVDAPGQPGWSGVGLGVTWRTPWSGQLTVGAENVITSGKNPFAPQNINNDQGAVPYVRYEQDL